MSAAGGYRVRRHAHERIVGRLSTQGNGRRRWPSAPPAIRDTPVDQVDANAVRRLLEPIWNKTPETASRVRARIEAVLASAQVAGHIDPDKPNPARWKGWLDHMLPNPRRLAERAGTTPAMPYANLPAFMARLAGTPGAASTALAIHDADGRKVG